MKTTAKENLLQLKSLLKSISESDYIKEREVRSGMSGKAELVTDSESDENNP